MTRLIIFGLLCSTIAGPATRATAAQAVSRPAIVWEKSDLGETAFVPMKAAPYPHPSRDKGYTYNKTDFSTRPALLRQHRRPVHSARVPPYAKVNVLVYLHGWSNNVRKAIAEYKLREQIAASGQNIILIFPEGPRDATDSGCGKLEDKDGLKQLVEESLATLHAAGKIDHETIGHVLIAGHSGAYKGLACCADHGGLEAELAGVCLLDSSYGNLEMFVNWVQKHPKGRFFSIFTDHLSAQNVYLFTHMREDRRSRDARRSIPTRPTTPRPLAHVVSPHRNAQARRNRPLA